MLPGYCSLKNQSEGLIRDLHLGLSQPSHQQLYCLPDPAVPALLGLQCIIFLSKLISLILYLPPSGFLLSPTLCSDRRSGCISPCLTSAYKTLGSAACPWITAWLGWCAGDKENKAKMHKTFFFFSWNPRRFGVGRDLQDHLVPAPLPWAGTISTRPDPKSCPAWP